MKERRTSTREREGGPWEKIVREKRKNLNFK